MDLSSIIQTRIFDIVHGSNEDIPNAYLYIFSDVFESNTVAMNAAKLTSYILTTNEKASVWVFCQSDRSQRDAYFKELRAQHNNGILNDLRWEIPEKSLLVPLDDRNNDGRYKRLWLCEIDEGMVIYN